MLILKLMSSQDMPDSDPAKNFLLVQVGDGGCVDFETNLDTDKAYPKEDYTKRITAVVRYPDRSEHYDLTGNAYVLNEHGKTIASRGAY